MLLLRDVRTATALANVRFWYCCSSSRCMNTQGYYMIDHEHVPVKAQSYSDMKLKARHSDLLAEH
jgi:hypothetical protein